MTFAEKARLAQQYLAIFHNHVVVLLTIGVPLIVIALIVLIMTASHWDNEIVPVIIVVTFFIMGYWYMYYWPLGGHGIRRYTIKSGHTKY